MHRLPTRGKQPYRAPVPRIAFEVLENRRLLTGSGITALDVTPSPVEALSLNATAGKRFAGEVGTWTNAGGLPSKSSGVVAVAIVNWGDGRTSHAKFVDDGSGVVQITAAHAWAKAGTFQTVVKVEEFPKGHPSHLTAIGQGDGSAVVAPKPGPFSVKGTITGSYTIPLGNPDARSYDFAGTGTAGALGAADLAGSISPPGFIKSAPATGELTLTGATGSVTIDLTGHTQAGGSALPQEMSYKVTSGTSAFANAAGKGTVSIAIDTTALTFVMVIH
jgi:hypothetical protein